MNRTTRPRPAQITLAFSLAVLFLLTHPYTGIRHDAILYTVQALSNAHPGNYARDLFFQFGSQDDWSIYGKLYGKLISLIGLRASNLACLFAAQVVWWTGAWRVIRKLVPPPWHGFCLFFVACMPADYGSSIVLSYDEMFLTARLPAEALGLWAIALTLEGRAVAGLALAALAAALHPLIGAVSLSVVLLRMTPRMAWWRVFLIALAVFAAIESPLFPALHLHPFDPQWREIARFNTPYLFPTLWDTTEWSKACWAIALPAVMWSTEPPENRGFWSNLTLLGVAGLAFSTVADVIGQDALWIQLQTWRTLWLLTLMQWPAAVLLVRGAARARPMLIWLLALCWLLLDVGGGVIALAIAAMLRVEAHRATSSAAVALRGPIPRLSRNALIGATLLCAPVWLAWQVAYHYVRVAYSVGSIPVNIGWLEALVHTRLAVALVAVLIGLHLTRERTAVAGRYVALVALGVLGLVNFDQRSDTAKVLEARADHANLAPFKGQVAAGDVVYWDGPPDTIVYPWFLMRTASYFSAEQAAGMIFHRQTTFEAVRRFARITQDEHAGRPPSKPTMAGQPTNLTMAANPTNPTMAADLTNATTAATADETPLFAPPKSTAPLSGAALRHVCQDPMVDFVVSRGNYPELSTHHAWSPGHQIDYWLYDCGQIRSIRSATRRIADTGGTSGQSMQSHNAQGWQLGPVN